MVHPIFVYGTLKTGQCRELLWPCRPRLIRRAWTLGQLYDLGPYPALIQGTDRIAGQVWEIRDEDIELTLKVLDRIEGTNQPAQSNEYDRVQVEVTLDTGVAIQATTYYYARHQSLSTSQTVPPNCMFGDQAYCIWPQGSTWEVPQRL